MVVGRRVGMSAMDIADGADIPPNQTIYINRLNEKIKKDGKHIHNPTLSLPAGMCVCVRQSLTPARCCCSPQC